MAGLGVGLSVELLAWSTVNVYCSFGTDKSLFETWLRGVIRTIRQQALCRARAFVVFDIRSSVVYVYNLAKRQQFIDGVCAGR